MTDWSAFLNSRGAIIANSKVEHFGDLRGELQAASDGDIMCDLSHLGLLSLHGADAVNFLQGQVTNDVKALNGQNAHLSAYCNAKGRMLALFLGFVQHDHIYLQLPKALLEPILKRLKMYVLRSKVVVEDSSNSFTSFGVNGRNAARILASSLGHLPTKVFELAVCDNALIIKLPSTIGDRFQIFTASHHAKQLWTDLEPNIHKASSLCWDWLEIQSGIPEILPQTQEMFVPQMLNLDALNGISYTKGCYTGQEIVARTHYLGKVKRHTYLAHIASDKSPQAGDALMAGQSEAGNIVRVAPHPSGGFDVLAELHTELLANASPNWESQPLITAALPYSF